MTKELVLEIDLVARMKERMLEAGFEQCEVERLGENDLNFWDGRLGENDLDFWKAVRKLLNGESMLTPREFRISIKDGGGVKIMDLSRKGDQLFLGNRPLLITLGRNISPDRAEVLASFKPEDLPPKEVLECLDTNRFLIPQSWRAKEKVNEGVYIDFLATVQPEESGVSGINSSSPSDDDTSESRWDFDPDTKYGDDEYVVYLGPSPA